MSYGAFRTDPNLEQKGVWMDYGLGFRVRLARAGGANRRYEKMMEEKIKPIRRAATVGALSKKVGDQILREVFCHTVILEWEVESEKDGKTTWKKGIEDPDTGEILKAEPANYLKVLAHPEIADLYDNLQADASAPNIFLKDARDIEGKNS